MSAPLQNYTFHDFSEQLIGTGLQGGALWSVGNQPGTRCEVHDLGPEPWNTNPLPTAQRTADLAIYAAICSWTRTDCIIINTWPHSISRCHIFKSFSHVFSNFHPNLASLILPLWSELSHAGSARRFMVGNPSAKSNLDKKSWAEKLFRVQLLQLLVHLFSMCLKSHCILPACRGLTTLG